MIQQKRIVGLLLVLQLISVAYLWAVTLVGSVSAGRFAIFLAIDLLSFSVVAYLYTHDRWEEDVGQAWVLLGAFGLMVLLLSSLYLS